MAEAASQAVVHKRQAQAATLTNFPALENFYLQTFATNEDVNPMQYYGGWFWLGGAKDDDEEPTFGDVIKAQGQFKFNQFIDAKNFAKGYYFWRDFFPFATNVNFMFVSTYDMKSKGEWGIYDQTYKFNKVSNDWNHDGHTGFGPKSYVYSSEVTDPDTLETSTVTKVVDDMDWLDAFHNMTDTDDSKKILKDKFDFCMNKGYTIVKACYAPPKEAGTACDALVMAEANNEGLAFLSCAQGVLGFNWPKPKYDGDRTKVKKKAGKKVRDMDSRDVWSNLWKLINLMAEGGVITYRSGSDSSDWCA